jgi:hypothetical protein
MSTQPSENQQDWRLQAELDASDTGGALHGLLRRLRGPDIAQEVQAAVAHDIVITHDGRHLFAYAATQDGLATARAAIENVLGKEGIRASISVGHWDEELDKWRQTDPPVTPTEQLTEDAAERNAERVETRTLIATSGKLVRAQFEQTMRTYAESLGVQCEIVEHPHLLSTQVAFTVSGPRYKIDEFARALTAEGWAFVRTDDAVMLSPL